MLIHCNIKKHQQLVSVINHEVCIWISIILGGNISNRTNIPRGCVASSACNDLVQKSNVDKNPKCKEDTMLPFTHCYCVCTLLNIQGNFSSIFIDTSTSFLCPHGRKLISLSNRYFLFSFFFQRTTVMTHY